MGKIEHMNYSNIDLIQILNFFVYFGCAEQKSKFLNDLSQASYFLPIYSILFSYNVDAD